jgi:hypothetical protein
MMRKRCSLMRGAFCFASPCFLFMETPISDSLHSAAVAALASLLFSRLIASLSTEALSNGGRQLTDSTLPPLLQRKGWIEFSSSG